MTLPRLRSSWRSLIPVLVLLGIVLLVVGACTIVPAASTAAGSPGATPHPTVTPTPTPLLPAKAGADPISLISFIFTPIFQVMFIVLMGLYKVIGDIGVAIVIMTILIRILVIPLFRQQMVSQRRMQLLQPEIREINKRFKGDRMKATQATQDLYKERGVNPAAGCLPSILQMFLLIPVYSVIRDGVTNYDPTALLRVFGATIVPLTCPTVPTAHACVNTSIWWLGGLDVGKPEIAFSVLGFGISLLALVSALFQVVQSRMMMPPRTGDDDPSVNMQRQMMLVLPLVSLAYGGILPAGLFIYWIVATIFSIVQQYLIVGWGSLFPLFGWNPGFAANHTPRFQVTVAPPTGAGRSVAETRAKPQDRAASAASTVRPHVRGGRQGRRGRRR